MNTDNLDMEEIATAPTRRHPYFLEFVDRPERTITYAARAWSERKAEPLSARQIHVIDMRELGPQRDAATLLRALTLFVISLALMCACGLMAALESGRTAALCFGATLIAAAGALLSAEVLGEELEHLFLRHAPMFARTRLWWERWRQRLRALAGGSTALSFGPY